MSKASNIAAIAISFASISTSALAQMRDPNIPAGAAILSGTPSGASAGSMAPRTVPPIGYVAPSATGGSSGCGGGSCGPIIAPGIGRHGRF
jgi:hypothetical protein